MSARLSSTPISIVPSLSEIRDGLLSQRNLEIAVRALSRDGLVVLEDMIDHATLDRLNVKMVEDAYDLQARKDSPFNYNIGNIQQDPPMMGNYFSEAIYTSKYQHFFDVRMSSRLTSSRSHSDSDHLNGIRS